MFPIELKWYLSNGIAWIYGIAEFVKGSLYQVSYLRQNCSTSFIKLYSQIIKLLNIVNAIFINRK
jgi:hypothetical protein